MNGIVIMDKPMGVTSFKALGIVKKAYNTGRVGHTGTLDPDATGVLPILVGKATRAAELITASDKRYKTTIKLGVRTDTLDLSGNITDEREVSVTEKDVVEAVSSFIGDIEQVPPMYSAVSVGGVRLYDLARQGREIEREKRPVTVYSIDILDISLPFVTLDVSCSKGTYIRTLADDIGMKLGTFAAVSTLRRTASGCFSEKDCFTPEEIANDPEGCILPIDSVFSNYDKIMLDEKRSKMVKNGVPIYFNEKKEGAVLRVYDDKGEFIALSKTEVIDGRLCLRMIKSFY